MTELNSGAGRPVLAILLQLQADGMVHSWVDDLGAVRWALTDAGKASSRAGDPIAASATEVLHHLVPSILVEDVVCPDGAGKLVVDVGPGVRMRLSRAAVPDEVEIGLLNVVLDAENALQDAMPVFPRRIRMDIGLKRTRPRSTITKFEFVVGGPIEFAGLFDPQGRLRSYSPVVQWGAGECRAARWTVCAVRGHPAEVS
jgi:hypothetical protein